MGGEGGGVAAVDAVDVDEAEVGFVLEEGDEVGDWVVGLGEEELGGEVGEEGGEVVLADVGGDGGGVFDFLFVHRGMGVRRE